MTDKPIIFSAPMIRAILEGRKTQTRRRLKPQPEFTGKMWHVRGMGGGCFCQTECEIAHEAEAYAPYSHDDRLWCREALDMGHRAGFPVCTCTYIADGAPVDLRPDPFWARDRKRWHVPSIHMPRWASRITLIVERTKVERVQDISEEDARAEGAVFEDCWPTYRQSFEALWNSIYGPGTWEANPWVCAITFRPIFANIDTLEA